MKISPERNGHLPRAGFRETGGGRGAGRWSLRDGKGGGRDPRQEAKLES